MYADSYVLDDEGMIIGTKLSSLKGKNIALCSEKSIAVYIILYNLYRKGKFGRKPSMILSTLATEHTSSEPHAFILIDKEQDNYPTKHLLYDIENPTLVEDGSGNKHNFIGIYSLSDEQFNDISDKRVYGFSKLDKTL